MLAHPYGYPVLMSSYAFNEDNDPVPTTSPHDADSGCGADWVCEHRRPTATTMIAFRKATAGAPVLNWVAADNIVSFSRGDRGHVIINVAEKPLETLIKVGLADGEYTDLLAAGKTVIVDGGEALVRLEPGSALVLLAK